RFVATGRSPACSPPPLPVMLVFVVAEPPDEAASAIVFDLVGLCADSASSRELCVVGSERHNLASSVDKRMPLLVVAARVPHQSSAVDEPVGWRHDWHRSTNRALNLFQGREPTGFGRWTRPFGWPAGRSGLRGLNANV